MHLHIEIVIKDQHHCTRDQPISAPKKMLGVCSFHSESMIWTVKIKPFPQYPFHSSTNYPLLFAFVQHSINVQCHFFIRCMTFDFRIINFCFHFFCLHFLQFSAEQIKAFSETLSHHTYYKHAKWIIPFNTRRFLLTISASLPLCLWYVLFDLLSVLSKVPHNPHLRKITLKVDMVLSFFSQCQRFNTSIPLMLKIQLIYILTRSSQNHWLKGTTNPSFIIFKIYKHSAELTYFLLPY